MLWILKAYTDQKLIKQTDKKSASVYEPSADKILKLQIAGNEEGTCIFTLLTSFLKAVTGQPCIFKWCAGEQNSCSQLPAICWWKTSSTGGGFWIFVLNILGHPLRWFLGGFSKLQYLCFLLSSGTKNHTRHRSWEGNWESHGVSATCSGIKAQLQVLSLSSRDVIARRCSNVW